MSGHSRYEHDATVQDWFDDWSESHTFRRLKRWLAYVQGYVLDQIDWSQTNKVLDVACGSGWAVFNAANRLDGKSEALAIGLDLSRGMLGQRRSASTQTSNAVFLNASAQAIPCRSDLLDAILCTIAFHHFPSPLDALAEFNRVLRPGGRLVLADTCRNQSILAWIWDLVHRVLEQGHVRYYHTSEIVNLLRDAGFQKIDIAILNPSYKEAGKISGRAVVFTANTYGGIESSS